MQRAPILPHTVCKVIDTNALQKTKWNKTKDIETFLVPTLHMAHSSRREEELCWATKDSKREEPRSCFWKVNTVI